MTTKEKDRAFALDTLREMLKPGDTVYTVLRHVSRSGMSRSISAVVIEDGVPRDVSWAVARAVGEPFDRTHDGVKVGGCGMDMGFHLVYTLSRVLFRDGFECIGEGCPSNDHSNPPYPPMDAGSMTHADGGYALTQRWL